MLTKADAELMIATIAKEYIIVNEGEYSAGEPRTLNVYQQHDGWLYHWEDDDEGRGFASAADARTAAYVEADQRWPGHRPCPE